MQYEIIQGDALEELRKLPDEHVQCVITSPPYWGLRDYGVEGQLGLEPTPEAHAENMVEIFREVRRVLRHDGTLWLNYGDCYAGSGGAGGDYNEGGLKEGQPKFPSKAKLRVKDAKSKQASNAAADFDGPHRVRASFRRDKAEVFPTEQSRGKRVPRGSGRWGGGNNPASGILKPKDLVGMPWRVAFGLQADGWWLRSDIIWQKSNPMPESVTDRPTKSHEHIFLLTKCSRYFYDADAVRHPHKPESIKRDEAGWDAAFKGRHTMPGERRPHSTDHEGFCNPAGRNLRDVWTIPTHPYPKAHFATFPPKLVEPCVKAGSKEGDLIFDPFAGSGTVGLVALKLGRKFLGLELNPDYCAMAEKRLRNTMPLFQGKHDE